LESLHRAAEGSEARRIIAEALPPVVASALREDDLDRIDQRLRALPNLSKQPLRREDWLAAIGVFLLVFLSTFPVVIPFMFVGNAWLALRISNAVAVGMLFLSGYALGRHSGTSPWKVGLAMIALGVMLVLVALALGG
jgi:VIT1/CCC1 family predicted Fe2+/Mn2+ transporter